MRFGALQCPRCGLSFYRVERHPELLTGYRQASAVSSRLRQLQIVDGGVAHAAPRLILALDHQI
jgi:hypothetical protein